METVDKKGLVIQTGWATIDSHRFINEILKGAKEVRVGVAGSKPPFAHVFLKVAKKEVIQIVRMGQYNVTFSIMFSSRVDEKLNDVVYINKLKMTNH